MLLTTRRRILTNVVKVDNPRLNTFVNVYIYKLCRHRNYFSVHYIELKAIGAKLLRAQVVK